MLKLKYIIVTKNLIQVTLEYAGIKINAEHPLRYYP